MDPYTGVLPGLKVMVDRATWWEFAWQQTPPDSLSFGGRKYGDYNLSSHGNQRIQADAWGVNPGVGWYVTTPNPFSPNGRQIQAAGPIYNTEGGSEAGFHTVELDGPNPSPTPTPGPSANPANKP